MSFSVIVLQAGISLTQCFALSILLISLLHFFLKYSMQMCIKILILVLPFLLVYYTPH